MDRGTIDVKLSTQDAYNKYLVWKQKPGTVFEYASSKRWFWVKKEGSQLGFVVAELKSLEGKKAVLLPNGSVDAITLSESEIDGYEMNDQRFDGVEDCAQMTHLSDASVLHNLKTRYDNDCIYTYSGLFCVALNPYIRFPIYTNEMIKFYQNQIKQDRAPHVFAMAQEAYTNLIRNKTSQSMLVTGESGAGKTENTKKIIQYLAVIAGNATASGERGLLEEQLIQANPLLEALGNAKTTKNDNSSRFGKFIKITFGHNGRISGASIKSYLLEKSRVTHQGPNERNFHIFYQLLNSFAGKDALGLTSSKDYAYITDDSASDVPSQPNDALFKETMESFDVLNFSSEERQLVFTIVAAVLHLGNIKFEENAQGYAKVVNADVLQKVAQLLGVDPTKLTSAIISPLRVAGKSTINVNKDKDQASSSRDALARQLYNRMFLWVVSKINETFTVTDDNFIGILDIAGFEIFKENSFEQLCINFTNERLQQFFNNHMFTLEQEEYDREGIPWKKIVYDKDNKPCIDLITKVFSTLVDSGNVSGSGCRDKAFCQKCVTSYKSHPKFSHRPQGGDYEFGIKHYAGEVIYTTKDWIEKNKDPLEADLQSCIGGSSNKLLAKFFVDFALAKQGAMTTVAAAYKDSLQDLMGTLQATFPHFIRCIIPNHQKLPHAIDASLVLEQLTCNGVLEGVRIARLGYPNRLLYDDFVKRYFIIVDEATKTMGDKKAATKKIMDKVLSLQKIPEKTSGGDLTFAFGKTKIFFKVGILAEVERYRGVILADYASKLQALARGYAGRKYYIKIKEKAIAATILTNVVRDWLEIRSWSWYKLYLKLLPLIPSPMQAQLTRLKESFNLLKIQGEELKVELKKLEEEESALEAEKQQMSNTKQEMLLEVGAKNSANEQTKKAQTACLDDLRAKSHKLQQQQDNLKNLENARKQQLMALEHLKMDKEKVTSDAEALNLAILEVQSKQNALKLEIEQKQNENSLAASKNLDENQIINEKKEMKAELNTKKVQIEREKAQILSDIEMNKTSRKAIQDEIKSLEGKKNTLNKEFNSLVPLLEDAKKKRIQAETNGVQLAQDFENLTSQQASEVQKTQNLMNLQKTLVEEHTRLTEELKVVTKARNDLNRKYEKEKKALNEATEQLSTTKDDNIGLASVIKRLEEEIATITKKLEESEILIGKLIKIVDELKDQCKIKQDNIDELAIKNAQLEGSNRRLAQDLEEITGVVGDGSEENEKLIKKKNLIDSNISSLTTQVGQEKEALRLILQTNEELKGKIAQTKVILESSEKELSQTTQATQKLLPQIKELEVQTQETSSSRKAIEEKKQLLQKKREEIFAKKEELEEAKSKLEEINQKNQSSKSKLEGNIVEVQNVTKGLTEKIKELSEAIDELKKDVHKIEIENESEERRWKNQQHDLSEKEPLIEDQKRKLIDQEKLITELEIDIKRQNVLLEELLIKKQAQDKQVTSKQEKIAQISERTKNFELDLKGLEKEISSIQLTIEEKELEIEATQKQTHLLKIQSEELVDDISEAKDDIERHGIQQEIEKQTNELVKQRNELLDKKLIAVNEKKKLLDEKKLIEDRIEPLLEDIKKLRAQNEIIDRENSNLQFKNQHTMKVLSQLETDNMLYEKKVAKQEKLARKEKSKRMSVTETLNNVEKDNALLNELKNQIKLLENEWRNDQRAQAQFNRQYVALEIEKEQIKKKLSLLKANTGNTIFLQEKLKREKNRLEEEKNNVNDLREALEIINIDKEAEAVRLKDQIKIQKEKQESDQEVILKLRKQIALLKPEIEREKTIAESINKGLIEKKSDITLGKLDSGNNQSVTFEKVQEKVANQSVVRETKRALRLAKKLESRLNISQMELDRVTSNTDKTIKNRDKLQAQYDQLYHKRTIAQKEVETLKNLIFDTQQFVRDMQSEEDKLQKEYEKTIKEIETLSNKIGIYSDQNIELERPDSDQEERKELEGKLQIILLESNRLKQELSVMKQANKTVRRENTDASIATNESIAMAKKLQKLVADQHAKTLIARTTFASVKVALHTYETKYNDTNREIGEMFKSSVKDTDNVRFDSQIETLTELLEKEQESLRDKLEEIEDLESLAEDLRFDCRAIKYELNQQNAQNRRIKREVFEAQKSLELKMRLQEVVDSEMGEYDEVDDFGETEY